MSVSADCSARRQSCLEGIITYLLPGETGSSFLTSFPPFANIKCPRFVFPDPASFAPSAAIRTRSGSDRSGYGNSFCMWEVSASRCCLHLLWFPCLKLPLLLSLGCIVTKTIHGEVVLRETRIDITEPARLRRATGCPINQSTGASLTWSSDRS
jgi:hypothetical protein